MSNGPCGRYPVVAVQLHAFQTMCIQQPVPSSERCGRMYDHGPGGLFTSSKQCIPDTLHRWQFRIDLGTRTTPIIDGVRVSIGQASDDSTVVASQQSELHRVHQS